MQWSIATTCLGGTLEAKLSAAAKAGFHAVEIFANDLTCFHGTPREVRRMADDLGLAIAALQPLRDFEAMPEPQRQCNFARAERTFALMHELGTDLLCICSKAWGREVKDWMTAWEMVKRADRPNLGVVLDSFHTFVRQNPVAPITQIPGHRITLVQVADAPDLVMDPLSLSRHYRCMPGQGDYPIAEFLRAVASTGYAGPISLEVFNDQFRSVAPSQIAVDGMRALQWYFDRLGLPVTAKKAHEPAPLPAIPRIHHLEFVEFTANAFSSIHRRLRTGSSS